MNERSPDAQPSSRRGTRARGCAAARCRHSRAGVRPPRRASLPPDDVRHPSGNGDVERRIRLHSLLRDRGPRRGRHHHRAGLLAAHADRGAGGARCSPRRAPSRRPDRVDLLRSLRFGAGWPARRLAGHDPLGGRRRAGAALPVDHGRPRRAVRRRGTGAHLGGCCGRPRPLPARGAARSGCRHGQRHRPAPGHRPLSPRGTGAVPLAFGARHAWRRAGRHPRLGVDPPARTLDGRRPRRARAHVAADVGLGTATNLRTHFRRLLGTTPSEYRVTFSARGRR